MRTSADALANVPVYGGWLPIETAPKTGGGEAAELVILGFAPDEEGFSPSTCEGFWNPSLERWSSSLDPTWRSSPQPTHWMSLPAPPASGAFPTAHPEVLPGIVQGQMNENSSCPSGSKEERK